MIFDAVAGALSRVEPASLPGLLAPLTTSDDPQAVAVAARVLWKSDAEPAPDDEDIGVNNAHVQRSRRLIAGAASAPPASAAGTDSGT